MLNPPQKGRKRSGNGPKQPEKAVFGPGEAEKARKGWKRPEMVGNGPEKRPEKDRPKPPNTGRHTQGRPGEAGQARAGEARGGQARAGEARGGHVRAETENRGGPPLKLPPGR